MTSNCTRIAYWSFYIESACMLTIQVKELERLTEVEAAVHVQTMEFLEKKRHQLQDEVDAWEER